MTDDSNVTKDRREKLEILLLQDTYNEYETLLCYLKVDLGYLKMCILNCRVLKIVFSKEV